MKVNFERTNTVKISSITVGKTFLADRKSENTRGLYMVIDHRSGLMRKGNSCTRKYAVNLETGQVREFPTDAMVEPANAEIVFC